MRGLFFYLFTFCFLTAQSQTDDDNWEAYLAQYDGGAGSTTVNMSLKTKTSFAQHRFLLITGVRFSRCKDGFPVKDEFEKLYTVSDSAGNFIKAMAANSVNAGSFTLECERVDYIYVTDTAHLRQGLTALYAKRFPSYTPIIKIKEDKAWEAYHHFLYPNEETMEQ